MGFQKSNLVRRIILALLFFSCITKSAAHSKQPLTSTQYVIYLFISIFLCCLAGVCSGLTVGYLSINKQSLILWLDLPDQEKVKKAKTILAVLQHHHLLLSTLLLTNALCMQALPIFLDKLVPAYLAIFISTLAVLIIGQVLPQAYCTGPNQIPIAYTMVPFVKFLEFIFAIFVKPIAWFLDTWLGHHQEKVVLNKQNIRTLLDLHNSKQYGYRPQQITILQKILDIRTITVQSVMTPINKVYMIDSQETLSSSLIENLVKYNLSVIPVFSRTRDNVKGVIKTRNFLGVDQNQTKAIKQLVKLEPAAFVTEGKNLLDVLDLFKSHFYMCFVLKSTGLGVQTYSQLPKGRQVIGMINLKQVFEVIVNKKFQDRDVQKLISGQFSNAQANKNKQYSNKDIQQGKEQD